MITLKTGLEEDVKLEGADYLMAAGFPILLFVVFFGLCGDYGGKKDEI